MPRDYKQREKKPESRKNNGWLWSIAALLVGLFAAMLWYVKTHNPEPLPPAPVARQKPAQEPKPAAKGGNSPSIGSRYQFYEMLPNKEVVIPEEEIHQVTRREKGAKATGAKASYLVQVASFKHFEEADSLKARLALEGLEAKIQKVEGADQTVWYRVRLGPFQGMREADRVRSRLQRQNLQPILLKVSG
jgi:cell division protein FtsN